MKLLKILGVLLGIYVCFSTSIFALQIHDSTAVHSSKLTTEISGKATRKFQKLKKRIRKTKNKLQNKQTHRNRVGRWMRDAFFKLGVILFLMAIAVVIGLLIAYGRGTTQLIGRFSFAFFSGLLALGLIIAIVDEDGIGKMTWLMGSFLTVIFAVVCPNEFELFLEIFELLS